MKSLLTGSLLLTLTLTTGCTQGTPGGPGATQEGSRTTYGQADNSFNLAVPRLTSSLQQGARADATIGIQRAENFDQDITLKFEDVPAGVTIEPASPQILHGDTDAKLVIHAGDEAPLGDFKIRVTGHPTKGSDAQVEFKLTVAPKDSFTLQVTGLPPLKQGASQTLSIVVQREKTFDQEIALDFGDLPTGVTIEPQTSTIPRGTQSAEIQFTATDDAALGTFDIRVTGHPDSGADASNEFKIHVVKN